MKKLTNLLIVVLLFTMATESFAQRVGIKAGANMSNMLVKDDDDTYSDDFKMKPGFLVGAVCEIPISDVIFFEPGLLLTTKGYKYSDSETIFGVTVDVEQNIGTYYIDIPLNFKAAFEMGDAKIYGAAGPFVGIGLSGKMNSKMSGAGLDTDETEDIKWGSDAEEDDFKRLDYGVSIGAGVELSALQIGLFYNLGLANISSYTDEGSTIQNRGLGLSVAWFFGDN